MYTKSLTHIRESTKIFTRENHLSIITKILPPLSVKQDIFLVKLKTFLLLVPSIVVVHRKYRINKLLDLRAKTKSLQTLLSRQILQYPVLGNVTCNIVLSLSNSNSMKTASAL